MLMAVCGCYCDLPDWVNNMLITNYRISSLPVCKLSEGHLGGDSSQIWVLKL